MTRKIRELDGETLVLTGEDLLSLSGEQRESSPSRKILVSVDNQSALQEIDGFGACFNELGWEALSVLDSDTRNALIEEFFHPEGNCRFNFCRMPIGANDFSTSWYSHNETAGDLEMRSFSIERDRAALIPFIEAARAVRPDLLIWASPWCPPSWMKKSGRFCSSVMNNNWGQSLGHESEDLKAASRIRNEPAILSAYALYFVRFVQAYTELGIPISAVQPQNEIFASQIFPSCLWDKEVLVDFMANYLAPSFQEAGLETEIWAGTFNGDDQVFTEWVLNHPALDGIIKGAGFQWKARNFLDQLNCPHGLKKMQTESECHNGSNSWETGELTFDLICDYLRAGVSSYMFWNFALDEWGLSHWGWRQNSLVSINHTTGKVTRNPDYYAMSHFSAHVEPGARYLPVQSEENFPCAAFLNPNQEIIFVSRNPYGEDLGIVLKTENSESFINIPARCMATHTLIKDGASIPPDLGKTKTRFSRIDAKNQGTPGKVSTV